eukprot:10776329-Alexandrium_andersonii.AAC.1
MCLGWILRLHLGSLRPRSKPRLPRLRLSSRRGSSAVPARVLVAERPPVRAKPRVAARAWVRRRL